MSKNKEAAEALELLREFKMSVRWSYHKQQWVAAVLSADGKRELQFPADDPIAAIKGAVARRNQPPKGNP